MSIQDHEFYSLDFLGFSNYGISSEGLVCSYNTNKVMNPHHDKRGYQRIGLTNDQGKYKTCTVHSLVAKMFIPNPEGKPQVDHIDGNKDNNSELNLRWATNLENAHYAMENGLMPHAVFDSDDSVRKVCQQLQDGVSPAKIAKETGFSYTAIQAVQLRRNWTHISKDFTFPPTHKQNYASKEEIKKLCKRIVEGASQRELQGEFPSLRRETIHRTMIGKIHKDVMKEVTQNS